MWLAAGSALAAMVGASWYAVFANGGRPPGGDMIGHAATAEWLRTLPWWDWRGWSDWFYGGQAIGVNYPPLGHAWMRFTHPVHGQMAAVAVGLLVLLPWGALRLARAVGYGPRAQRAAVAAVMVLAAASRGMHWVLPGFHPVATFYGSWPRMVAISLGLHVAAWAARCRRPVLCGVVAGIAALLNATVAPGVAVVCAALLATSGASFGRAVRWAATSGSVALAMCAWWLVPFLASWERIVDWGIPLHLAWSFGGWQAALLAVVGAAAAWAARLAGRPTRRLAAAALAGLVATVAADYFGYPLSERWLAPAVLLAAMAVAGLAANRSRRDGLQPARPAWAVLGAAFIVVFVVVTLRLEWLALAAWLLLPRRTWAWAGALAWAAVLLSVPLVPLLSGSLTTGSDSTDFLEAVVEFGGPDTRGLVYVEGRHQDASGELTECGQGHAWGTMTATEGRLRPLHGVYRELSPVVEFLDTRGHLLRDETYQRSAGWARAWEGAGRPDPDSRARAAALGAEWHVHCDGEGSLVVTELPGTSVTGVAITPHPDDDRWHQAAVKWWISADQYLSGVPVLRPMTGADDAYPPNQAARGMSLDTAQDSLTIRAQQAGWAWVRVPWDPDWRSTTGLPVLKGGPSHLVVWAERGETELRWSVPGQVDAAAAVVTAIALSAAGTLSVVNRRRGFPVDIDRPRPAADAVGAFADTVDGWWHGATRNLHVAARRR